MTVCIPAPRTVLLSLPCAPESYVRMNKGHGTDTFAGPVIEEKTVACPTCGGDSVYALANAARPFCSPRCRDMDLGAWASESFRMPADMPSGDETL